MALRAPLPDDALEALARPEPATYLELVHASDAPIAVEERAGGLARGVMWGLLLVVAGFWAPLAAAVAYLVAR